MPSRKTLADTIRVLSMDAVEKAKSGHPGAPMGMADIAEVLWRDYLKHNPANPNWADRDRFVLSNGHASILLYSLLHLTGYNLPMEQLKNFRQLHSQTPGHPEYGYTPGVETTTGPLGQGIANAVGFAIAERTLGAQFNREGHTIIDHRTYVFMGDGCMMEGISHEACSLAGTLKLGKLMAFYDSNGISIDGNVKGWFTDDTAARFKAYGWHVVNVDDGHDVGVIKAAIEEAHTVTDKPSLLICKTKIGYGSPNKAGTHDVHGAPLGAAEIAATRVNLEWKYPAFNIPPEISAAWDAKKTGEAKESAWNEKVSNYTKAYPAEAAEFERRNRGEMPTNWLKKAEEFIAQLQAQPADIPSRNASQNALKNFGKLLPELLGGSADLAPSNLTMWKGWSKPLIEVEAEKDPEGNDIIDYNWGGNYIHYGVREFGMSAIMNGIALHGGFIPYGATFLMFVEYARNAVRMAALMKIRSVFVYTHDSIGLGEDGPTHQPVEQMASLRVTPNLSTWRPCDQVESAVAWRYALERKEGPSALIFSRQKLVQQSRDANQLENIARGGYVLLKESNKSDKNDKSDGQPELILIATGSEVALAVSAHKKLTEEGHKVRVVSMPSTDVFDTQGAAYRESVLPAAVSKRMAIEAGISDYWYKYVGLNGAIIGMTSFGESAPADDLFKKFGFTVDNVVAKAQALLKLK